MTRSDLGGDGKSQPLLTEHERLVDQVEHTPLAAGRIAHRANSPVPRRQ
jgi:hypothetical protein